MNTNFLIVSIVFGSLAFLLILHHFIKHSYKPNLIKNKLERIFQIEDIYNFRFTHEKFILIFAGISIGFGVASALN